MTPGPLSCCLLADSGRRSSPLPPPLCQPLWSLVTAAIMGDTMGGGLTVLPHSDTQWSGDDRPYCPRVSFLYLCLRQRDHTVTNHQWLIPHHTKRSAANKSADTGRESPLIGGLGPSPSSHKPCGLDHTSSTAAQPREPNNPVRSSRSSTWFSPFLPPFHSLSERR